MILEKLIGEDKMINRKFYTYSGSSLGFKEEEDLYIRSFENGSQLKVDL